MNVYPLMFTEKVWTQLLNDKHIYVCYITYAITLTFTIHTKHVHAYGYSNIFSIDYVTTRTLESHSRIHSRVMMDTAQWLGETMKKERGALTCIAGQCHGVTVCRCPRVRPQSGGIPRLWRKRMKDQTDTLFRNRSTGGHKRVEQIPTKTSNILKHRC